VVNNDGPPRGGGHQDGETAGGSGVLRETLRAARNLLRPITSDPLLLRLLDVYTRTPAQDRDVIVGVLEREVTLRRLSDANARSSSLGGGNPGITVTRPNPNARLYVRVLESSVPAPYLSREEMMRATVRMARATYLTLATTAREGSSLSGIRDALARLSPEELAAVDWANRNMRELIDEAVSSAAAASTGVPAS
jgi:hypothetical protein